MNRKRSRSRWAEILGHDTEISGHVGPKYPLRAAKTLWGRAQQHAQEKAAESVRIDRSMLQQQVERLAATRNELDQEQNKLNERAQAMGAALAAKDQQIADMVRQLTALQKCMVTREGEVEQLRAHIAAQTSAQQAERGRLDALNKEHMLERRLLEQRASVHEKRLLEDVDRARQEAKRLQLILANENKKASQQLADSQEQIQSLRLEVGVLRSENSVLAREMLSAREDLRTAQSQQEQFRSDTAALLAEFKAHLPKNEATAALPATRRHKLKAAPGH